LSRFLDAERVIDDPETSSDQIPEDDFEGYDSFFGDEDGDGFAVSDPALLGQPEPSASEDVRVAFALFQGYSHFRPFHLLHLLAILGN
jgi:hypothetical protein